MIVSQYLSTLHEYVLDIPLNTLRSLHDNLVSGVATAVFILGCNNVDDNHHQMAYPILQLFNLLTDDGYILKVIYYEPSCDVSQAESTNLA